MKRSFLNAESRSVLSGIIARYWVSKSDRLGINIVVILNEVIGFKEQARDTVYFFLYRHSIPREQYEAYSKAIVSSFLGEVEVSICFDF